MTDTKPTDVVIGVDTHKNVHAVAAVNALGVHLASMTIPASIKGYQALETWAISQGTVRAIGIEGTGSYGAGVHGAGKPVSIARAPVSNSGCLPCRSS